MVSPDDEITIRSATPDDAETISSMYTPPQRIVARGLAAASWR
jgi:hypothetical protein